MKEIIEYTYYCPYCEKDHIDDPIRFNVVGKRHSKPYTLDPICNTCQSVLESSRVYKSVGAYSTLW